MVPIHVTRFACLLSVGCSFRLRSCPALLHLEVRGKQISSSDGNLLPSDSLLEHIICPGTAVPRISFEDLFSFRYNHTYTASILYTYGGPSSLFQLKQALVSRLTPCYPHIHPPFPHHHLSSDSRHHPTFQSCLSPRSTPIHSKTARRRRLDSETHVHIHIRTIHGQPLLSPAHPQTCRSARSPDSTRCHHLSPKPACRLPLSYQSPLRPR